MSVILKRWSKFNVVGQKEGKKERRKDGKSDVFRGWGLLGVSLLTMPFLRVFAAYYRE